MKKYRLKPEAVPFFKDKMATAIHTFDVWKDHNVDEKALEEVEECHITYGHDKGDRYTTLGGWSADAGTRFEFTIHFPSVKFHEHDKFSKGKVTRELMNTIQRQINNFYEQFNNQENEQS
jgi:hypothetical protein